MGQEPNPKPRRESKIGFTLTFAGDPKTDRITKPLRNQQLAAFSHLSTRRERRAALRTWKRAVVKHQKLVEQAHKDDTIRLVHAEAVTMAEPKVVKVPVSKGMEQHGKVLQELFDKTRENECNPQKPDFGTDSTSVG